MTRISPKPSRRSAAERGFTLIELMIVVGILGVLAAIAIQAYSKNVRTARRTEVMANLSNIAMKESTFWSVRGHYASTTDDEDTMYPVDPADLDMETGAITWVPTDAKYHSDTASVGDAFMPHGGSEHGFDALNFIPEGAQSWCSYGVISGGGTNGVPLPDAASTANNDVPTGLTLGDLVFPASAPRYFARDWFYAFAKCDFDRDGVFWEFTIPHYDSKVSDGDGSRFGE